MKKLKIFALIIMLAFLVSSNVNTNADETVSTPNKLIVFKIGHNKYYTQDIGSTEVKTVQMDTAPFIKDSRTYVPVRFLGNALGVSDSNIAWDNSVKKAVLQGRSKLTLTIGSKTMQKNNENIVMDVAPLIANPGRTMLPARYVAEGLGFKVEWDAAKQLVIAYPEDQPKPDIENILKELNNSSITVQDLGNATGVQYVEANGYKIGIGTNPSPNSTAIISIGDANPDVLAREFIRVVCTSHPEFNTCRQPGMDGKWYTLEKDVWTNNYMLFRDGYTTNPKSGMTVTFDIYGGYNGDESYEGVKIATIRKTLP